MVVIEDRALVEIAYVLRDDSGDVIDATDGRSFTFVQGEHQVVPGVEQALAGMKVGDTKDLVLCPDDAYGRVDPLALAEVPKGSLPPEALVAGTALRARKPSGETMVLTVAEVRDDTVVLDLNHPLAGKTLHVHLRVLQIVPQPS